MTWDPPRFKNLGWYSISGWVEPCPECGVYRGGSPGYHWHVVRENSDDREKIREAHGEEYVIMGTLREDTDDAIQGQGSEDDQPEHLGVPRRGDLLEDEEEVREEEGGQASNRSSPGHGAKKPQVDG